MKKGTSISVYVTIIIVIVLASVVVVNIFTSFTKATLEDIASDIKKSAETETSKGEETGEVSEYNIDLSDYEKVNISIILTNIGLASNCYMISFDVTLDQAYSISQAIDKEPSTRPLTHDIFRDVLENFGIEILAGVVSDFRDGIYYAKIYAKSANKVLELDARPSDTIALLLRLDMPLYVKKTVLENSTYIC